MFDTIRNWFEVRAAMKDERRLRNSKSSMNTLIVIDKLKHVGEMLQTGQRGYAIQGLEEMLARYPDEAGDLPETLGLLISVGRLDEAEALAVPASPTTSRGWPRDAATGRRPSGGGASSSACIPTFGGPIPAWHRR